MYKPLINGVVIAIEQLIKQLEEAGHEVKLLALSTDQHDRKEGNIYYLGSFSVGIYPELRASIHMKSTYFQEIIDWHPDIIHTQNEFSTFRFAKSIAKELHIPMVHTYHTLYQYYMNYLIKNKRLGHCLETWATRKILKQVQVIIAPTNKVKQVLRGYSVKQPIEVIPTTFQSLDFHKITDSQREAIRKTFGISKNQKLILTAGRLAQEKNMEELLLFFSHLLKEEKNVIFLIVGDGPHKGKLEALVRQLGIEEQVVFAGMIAHEHMNAIYQSADVFVGASISETQGLTYYEAMMNGLPIVGRADDCLKGVVIHGENGLLYRTETEFQYYIQMILEYGLPCSHQINLLQAPREITCSMGTKMHLIYCQVLQQENIKEHVYEQGYGETC